MFDRHGVDYAPRKTFAQYEIEQQEQMKHDREAIDRLWANEYRAGFRVPRWLRLGIIIVATFLLSWLFLSVWPARADTITQVATYIDANAVLPLQGDVPEDLAENILAAQAAASYASPLSLLDSENAVLKAIGLYVFAGGPKRITDTDAPIVWSQSTIAIDPNAGGGLSPAVLNFGEVALDPVSTPEPATWALLVCGSLYWLIAFFTSPKRRAREYGSQHHAFRK
jgi:hypothetical protein